MLAAYQIDQRRLEVREVPDPEPPEGGLILRVEACGVCGSDLRRWREGLQPGAEPFVPGHEVAGVVEAIGAKSAHFSVGDRLALGPDIHCGRCWYCVRGLFNLCDHMRFLGITPAYPGGFAEKMVLTADVLANGIVHRIPDDMPFEIGAMAEPCSSVLATHAKIGTRLNDVVVVIGAGPVGCLLVSVAKARGARVIVIQRSAIRRELVKRLEPDAVIDPTSEAPIDAVRRLTDGLGADIVICANPSAATQTDAVHMVRKGGKVVLFGGLPKANPMTTLDGNIVHYSEIEVIGSFSYHPTDHAEALELFARKMVPVERLISHRMPLAQVNEAFEMADRGEALKVIVGP